MVAMPKWIKSAQFTRQADGELKATLVVRRWHPSYWLFIIKASFGKWQA